jgi:hypothetical protein
LSLLPFILPHFPPDVHTRPSGHFQPIFLPSPSTAFRLPPPILRFLNYLLYF